MRSAPLVAIAVAVLFPSLALATPRHPKRRSSVERWPAVMLEHLTTNERYVLRPDIKGQLRPHQLRGFRRFLRCHHTGKQHPIALRLATLLYATAHRFGDRRISIVAGYRAPRVAREKGNPKSPHKRGLACDFRIEGVPLTELRDYLRNAFHRVGVGYYPNAGFVHVDVGRRGDVFWIDYSHPGERSRYTPPAAEHLPAVTAEGANSNQESGL